MGDTSAICPPTSCASRLSAPATPPLDGPSPWPSWNRNDTQPCPAFHQSTGAITSEATSTAAYGPAAPNMFCNLGCDTNASATAAGKSTLVYFDDMASPMAMPSASHQRRRCPAVSSGAGSIARTRKYIAHAMAHSIGASGVASTRPAAASGRQLNARAATRAAASPASSRAVSVTAAAAPVAASIGKKRTPKAWSPNSAVPARISSAITGG